MDLTDGRQDSFGLGSCGFNQDVYIIEDDFTKYMEMGVVHEDQTLLEQMSGIQQFINYDKSSAQIGQTESGADGPEMNEMGWDGNNSSFGI